jgi:hypothetical protein
MELFAAVNRKFRYLFAQQEHMKTFKTYDLIEVIIKIIIMGCVKIQKPKKKRLKNGIKKIK